MLKARSTIKIIIVLMSITLLTGCNNEVINCLANSQESNCFDFANNDFLYEKPSSKIDQGGAPISSSKIDQGG